MLTVTHDLEYCWNVADRIIILDDKHLVKDMMLAEFDDYEASPRRPRSGVTARTSTSAFPRADGKHEIMRRHRVPFIEQGEHSECGWPPQR